MTWGSHLLSVEQLGADTLSSLTGPGTCSDLPTQRSLAPAAHGALMSWAGLSKKIPLLLFVTVDLVQHRQFLQHLGTTSKELLKY